MLKYVDVFSWRNVKTEEFALVRWIGFKATYHIFSIFRSANAIDFSSKSLLQRSNLNLIHFTCLYVRKWIATVSRQAEREMNAVKMCVLLCCLVDSAYVASHRQNFLRHHQWIEITKISKNTTTYSTWKWICIFLLLSHRFRVCFNKFFSWI